MDSRCYKYKMNLLKRLLAQALNINLKKEISTLPSRPFPFSIDFSFPKPYSSPRAFLASTNYTVQRISSLKRLKDKKPSAFIFSSHRSFLLSPPLFYTVEERHKEMNSHYHSPAPLSGNVPPRMEYSTIPPTHFPAIISQQYSSPPSVSSSFSPISPISLSLSAH